MVILIEPNEKYLNSYIQAFNEYKDNNVTTYAFDDATLYDIFEKYDNYKNERNLKPNRVGSHYYWLVDNSIDLFIGEISIRHKLTDELIKYGGHIGYGVRFSEWGKGYGSYMLKLGLEKAREIGISKVLITCNDDNLRSSKVMENNNMILQDKIENNIDGKKILTRRYWKDI